MPQLYFADDDEWSVVMFGLPGDQYNIEFIAHRDEIDGTTPRCRHPAADPSGALGPCAAGQFRGLVDDKGFPLLPDPSALGEV